MYAQAGVCVCLTDIHPYTRLLALPPLFYPPATRQTMVHTVIPLPGPVEQFLVVNRSSTAYVTTAQGQVRASC